MDYDWNKVLAGIPGLEIAQYQPDGWPDWLRNFKIVCRAANNFDMLPESRKVSLLMSALGRDIQTIFKTFDANEDVISFDELVDNFNKYFGNATLTFLRQKQRPEETFESFAKKLTVLSGPCLFGYLRDKLIRDVFVLNLNNQYKDIQMAIESTPNCTLEEAVKLANEMVQSKSLPKPQFQPASQSSRRSYPSGQLPQFITPAIAPNETIDVEVLNIFDNETFVSPTFWSNARNQMIQELSKAMCANSCGVIKNPEENRKYAVQYKKAWYRAVLLSRREDCDVVHLLDYGWKLNNFTDSYRFLPLDFSIVKPLAVKITFKNKPHQRIQKESIIKLTFLEEQPQNNGWLVTLANGSQVSSDSSRANSEAGETSTNNRAHYQRKSWDGPKKNGSRKSSDNECDYSRKSLESNSKNGTQSSNFQKNRRYPNNNTREGRTDNRDTNERVSNSANDHKHESKPTTPTNISRSTILERHKNELRIPKGCYSPVTILNLSGDILSVCPSKETPMLIEISTVLTNRCKSLPPCPPLVHRVCAAPYEGEWYRCQILAINEYKQTVNVCYYDFGNVGDVPISDIKILPVELEEIPPVSFSIKAQNHFDIASDNIEIKPLNQDSSGVWVVEIKGVDDDEKSLKNGVNLSKSSVLSPSQRNGEPNFTAPPIPKDKFTAVTFVDEPQNDIVFVCELDQFEHLEKMNEKLNKNINESPTLATPSKGKKCAAPFDGTYYRCEITAVNNKEQLVKVFYFDFGNKGKLEFSKLKSLDRQLEEIRPFSFPIKTVPPSNFSTGPIMKIKPIRIDTDGVWIVELDNTKTDDSARIGLKERARGVPPTRRESEDHHKPQLNGTLPASSPRNSCGEDKPMKNNISSNQSNKIQAPSHESQTPIPKDEFTTVAVVYDTELGTLYVCPLSEADNLCEMTEKLTSMYANSESSPSIVPSIGQKCCAPFDNKWYRCSILSANKINSKAHVFFFDFGNNSVVEFSQLKHLPEQFEERPPLSFQIKVPNNFKSLLSEDGTLDIKPKYKGVDGSWVVDIKGADNSQLDGRLSKCSSGETPVVSKSPHNKVENKHDLEPPIAKNKFTSVHVIYYSPQKEIFVISSDKLNDLEEISVKVTMVSQTSPLCTQVVLNQMCIAPYENEMFRAKVLSINDQQKTCRLLFVDYGNCEDLPFNSLRNLPKDLLVPSPTFQIRLDPKSEVIPDVGVGIRISPVALEENGCWYVQVEGEPLSADYQLPDPMNQPLPGSDTNSDKSISFKR